MVGKNAVCVRKRSLGEPSGTSVRFPPATESGFDFNFAAWNVGMPMFRVKTIEVHTALSKQPPKNPKPQKNIKI